MKHLLLVLFVSLCYSNSFAKENACDEVERECGAGEDDYEVYGQCISHFAPPIKAFVYNGGLICEGEKNYCLVAKNECNDLVASKYYSTVNECLQHRASSKCISK